MHPCRQLGQAVNTVSADKVRPINVDDFGEAMQSIRPSVNREQLAAYEAWTRNFGTHS